MQSSPRTIPRCAGSQITASASLAIGDDPFPRLTRTGPVAGIESATLADALHLHANVQAPLPVRVHHGVTPDSAAVGPATFPKPARRCLTQTPPPHRRSWRRRRAVKHAGGPCRNLPAQFAGNEKEYWRLRVSRIRWRALPTS